MLTKIRSRQENLGLSLRNLAKQLEVSPTLLSLVLNEKREPSKTLSRKLSKWLHTPVASEMAHCPSALVDQFVNDKASHLASSTLEFYRNKLRPFAMWCEKKRIADVREIQRVHISEFLSFVRKGHTRPLNAGGIKLYHQTLKTYFNYVGETCDIADTWKHPVDGIKVKGSQAETLEYSDAEIKQMFQIIDKGTDELLRLRNRGNAHGTAQLSCPGV